MSANPLIHRASAAPSGGYRAMKRALDLSGSAIGLVLLAPLLLGVALAIAVSSGSASLFRQHRVGQGGHEFMMWKFRTMRPDADQERAELFAHSRDAHWLQLDHDPRITRLGGLLRRCSLDELPQLVNILLGEMSFVGPRPLPVAEEALAPDWSQLRLEVRPGLTGLWQVMGRTRLPFLEMLRLDCEYVRAASWRTDMRILVRTIPAVLSGRGAN